MLDTRLVGEIDEQDAVRGRDADRHDGSHEGLHVERGLGQEQHPQDPREGSRNGEHDEEGIEPRLIEHDQNEVDKRYRDQHPEAETAERVVHRLTLSGQANVHPLGQRS